MIASIVERAKAQDVPVMVVTGDRDAYQLVDDGLIKIMTTSRGITDTKVYDREGVIDRYGIAPELIPDFIGLKGDTSDNIPGVPGIGDKTAAQLLQEFGTLEDVLANVDKISGAKRKENLVNHAEDARISKQLATMVRDIPVDVDPSAEVSKDPDRSQLREALRRFEIREPLRRLEEALDVAEAEPVPAATGELALTARVREAPVGQVGKLKGDPLAIAARPPEVPDDALFTDETWRFGAIGTGDEALAGEIAGPQELVEAVGERPVAVHDAKALLDGPAQPRPRHPGGGLPDRPGGARVLVRRAVLRPRRRVRRRGPRGARRRPRSLAGELAARDAARA